MKSNLGLTIVGQYIRHSPIETAKWRLGRFLRKRLTANPVHSTVRMVGGSFMDLDTSEFLQRELYIQRELDPSIRLEITRRLKPGETFLDIGANVGFYTLIAAKVVGRTGSVYAFEPAPNTRAGLERNIQLNDFGNVTTVPVALSDATGIGELFLDAKKNSGAASLRRSPNSGESVSVVVDTYDNFAALYALPIPALVKIDVEGSEVSVLRGMTALLSRPDRPAIILEVSEWSLEEMGYSKAELFRLVTSFGYRATLLTQPVVSIFSGQNLYFQYDVLFEPTL